MARRAVSAFMKSSYPIGARYLYVLDSGNIPCIDSLPDCYLKHFGLTNCGVRFSRGRVMWAFSPDYNIAYHRTDTLSPQRSIGDLRNYAASWQSDRNPDVFIHWDDDDWSHPNRIAEQVAFLQQSGADAVGYREMLFWRTDPGEAWIYSNPHPRYCLGTSLCYWRSAWERNPFPDTSRGEEGQPLVGWQSKLNCVSQSSVDMRDNVQVFDWDEGQLRARMIALIHGGNTCSAIDTNSPFWKHVPVWDEYCRERMAL